MLSNGTVVQLPDGSVGVVGEPTYFLRVWYYNVYFVDSYISMGEDNLTLLSDFVFTPGEETNIPPNGGVIDSVSDDGIVVVNVTRTSYIEGLGNVDVSGTQFVQKHHVIRYMDPRIERVW